MKYLVTEMRNETNRDYKCPELCYKIGFMLDDTPQYVIG